MDRIALSLAGSLAFILLASIIGVAALPTTHIDSIKSASIQQ